MNVLDDSGYSSTRNSIIENDNDKLSIRFNLIQPW